LSEKADKLVVILGPTSSGKSSLAIKLAQKFNGEIVSADSRQVYKGMNIGTGKISKTEQAVVPHHLLDMASPKKSFNVAEYKPLAQKAIEKIRNKNKLPFLVGGTPFWIYAVIDNLQLPEVAPNPKLRKQLEKKSTKELFTILKKLDPRRAKSIDAQNPRRLIRAIEIIKTTRKPISPINMQRSSLPLILGIKKEQNKLYKLIDERVRDRFKQGLMKEVKKLLASGVSQKRLAEIGLTYKIAARGIKNKIPESEIIQRVQIAERKFSKRQMTWFKTDQRIKWIANQKQASSFIEKYLKNK